ncbi:MAG: hypothetical protein V4696_03745 [Pseudomonadota bacterium]
MGFRLPRHSGTLLIVALAVVIIFSFSTLFGQQTISDQVAQRYEIPPSFNGHRVLFGLNLAFVLSMALLSAGTILENARWLFSFSGRWHEPSKVVVVNESLMLATIFCGVLGNCLVLLAWGEEGAPGQTTLVTLDRVLDIIAGLFLFTSLVRRIRSRPVVLFHLQREPLDLNMSPTWAQLAPKLRIAIVVVALSFGVAFAK